MNKATDHGVEPDSILFAYKQQHSESYYHHAHRGIEMLYIYEGHGEIMVDNLTYPIENHSLVWFQPYQLHRVAVPLEPGRSYTRTNLTFDPHLLERYLAPFPVLERFYRTLWKGHLRKPFFTDLQDSPIPALLERFHLARGTGSPGQDEEIGLLLLNLIQWLQKNLFKAEAEAASDIPSRAQSHAERITEWLDEHYRKPFKLEELAESLHLSPYHVSHVFKKSAGMTLSDYVIRRRVREACALLANTSKSVQEIASELGGLSTSYFCQMFKRAKGVSPEQYRRSIR
ncbi:helix-turn-helix transcriptional regulator [Cohnella thailandensis]|uniref:Helix-turn-helix transcriptional regulator n=1 Tax=Cohnella thailandensis TaxID=557557 RepID=A0A841SPJ7_9BACL|nr:AraC family transcriptional regulator [Cohnella thailandensis]MBB6633122.1 helix-turn-helix transcriptional regulator [Cohnella thailandensis]MBP1975183.1 AraC-like DNA-binding protein [Cohnella thailandensis]